MVEEYRNKEGVGKNSNQGKETTPNQKEMKVQIEKIEERVSVQRKDNMQASEEAK